MEMNDIVNKELLLAWGNRMLGKGINVFQLYEDLNINLDGVGNVCETV